MPLLRKATAEPPPELIFDWRRASWARRRLFISLLGGVLIIIGWFYLFRVSLPPPGRAIPVGRSLSVVSDPALSKDLRTQLRAVQPGRQRYSGARAADQDDLHKMVPSWQPVWTNRPPVLRELPDAPRAAALPAVIPDGAVLLPPVEGSEPLRLPAGATPADPEAPPVIAPLLTVQSGPLGERTVTAQPRWKPEIFDEGWPAAGSVAVMLAVDESGRTVHCFPLNASPGADPERLRPELMKLRWSPLTGCPLAWGTIEVRW